MLYPLKFYPIFQERIWGGSLIRDYLGRKVNISSSNIGESWDICDREDNQSIVCNGSLKNKTLGELKEQYREALVGSNIDYTKPFPLLVKILDAREDLSLQVHPRAVDLPNLESQAQTKTEFWYILKHTQNAKIMAGLKSSNKAEFEKNLFSDKIVDFVHSYESQDHGLMYIESGTLHAIGGGNLILEIQENSDTTYRVSDWGRKDQNGNPRDLHVKEGLSCIDFSNTSKIAFDKIDLQKNYQVVDSALFQSYSYFLNSKVAFHTKEVCQIISITQGTLKIEYQDRDSNNDLIDDCIILKTGESALLAPNISMNLVPLLSANYLITTVKQGS